MASPFSLDYNDYKIKLVVKNTALNYGNYNM